MKRTALLMCALLLLTPLFGCPRKVIRTDAPAQVRQQPPAPQPADLGQTGDPLPPATPDPSLYAGPDATEQLLVDNAARILRNMVAGPEMETFRILLREAKGVMVFPKVVKAALVHLGGEGGNGVMTMRTADGGWSAPAFYSQAEGTIGIELGYQESSYVILLMNDRSAYEAMGGGMTLGAAVAATAVKSGGSAELPLAGEFRDTYFFTNTRGLYAGAAIEGGGIQVRSDLNEAYYGQPATPADILVAQRFENHPGAQELRDALAQ